MLNSISGLPPDSALYKLLDLNPSYDRTRFDNDAVRKAIQQNPDVAKAKYYFKVWGGEHRNYPLFMVVALGASADVVELFYEGCPEAIRARTESGWTPLHYACYHGAKPDVVKLLIDKYPEAVQEQDKNGNTPLMISQNFHPSRRVSTMLMNASSTSPPSANTSMKYSVTTENAIPISRAEQTEVREDQKRQQIQPSQLLRPAQDPPATSSFTNDVVTQVSGAIPDPVLYKILDMNPSYDKKTFDNNALRDTVQRNPDGCKALYYFQVWGGNHKNYPLFMAVALGATPDVVEFMYDACPEAISAKTESGWTPLHYACYTGASVDIVKLLVEKYPEALQETDKNGNTPLMIAQSFQTSRRVSMFLQDASSRSLTSSPSHTSTVGTAEARSVADVAAPSDQLTISKQRQPPLRETVEPSSFTPISSTAPTASPDPVLYKLLDLNPSYDKKKFDNNAVRGAVQRNPDGCRALYYFKVWGGNHKNYPLFMAVALGATPDVVELMYDACPEAISSKTESGWTPLHYACYTGASADVVKLLVDKYPEALEERDKNGNTPLMIAQSFQTSRRVSTMLMNASSRSLVSSSSLSTIQEKDVTAVPVVKHAEERSSEPQKSPPQAAPMPSSPTTMASPDPVLYKLLDLNPFYDKKKFDNNAVRGAVQRNPDGCKALYYFKVWGGNHKNYPLFMAVALGATPDVVELMYDACPEAISSKTESGWTPLHYACYTGASADVVKLLIYKYPGALEERDKNGNTPLMIAQSFQTSHRVSTFLIDASLHNVPTTPPQSTVKENSGEVSDRSGDNLASEDSSRSVELFQHAKDPVLYKLLDLNPSYDKSRFDNDSVRSTVQSNPDGAKAKYPFKVWGGDHENYPLFMAVALGASHDVVELIYDACPEAVAEKTVSGWTPLHYACYNGATVSVVKFLVEKHADAINSRDKNGNTPLTIATNFHESRDVVDFLRIEASRNVIVPEPSKTRTLPMQAAEESEYAPDPVLHKLLDLNPSYEQKRFDNNAVRIAVESNPDSAKAKYNFKVWGGTKNNYPIFMAVPLGASRDVIELMIDHCPDAVRAQTDSGWTPLHYVCYHGASAEVIKLLVDKYPEAMEQEDKNGDTPLILARRHHPSRRVSMLLNKESSRRMSSVASVAKREEDSVLCRLLDLNPFYDKDKFDNAAVFRAVRQSPGLAKVKYSFKEWGGVYYARPIFMAVALGASLDVIELIYNACPEAVSDKTETGWTPLHYACYCGAPADVIKLLVEKNPGAVEDKDNNGYTPMMYAQNYHPTHRKVSSVFIENTSQKVALGLTEDEKDEMTSSGSLKDFQQLWDSWEETILSQKSQHIQASPRSFVANKPIQYPEDPVLYKLLDLNPSYERKSFNNDALRDAIQRNPDGTKSLYGFKVWQGNHRNYPLFMAVALGASPDVVELMCDACPEAVKAKTESGWTPLHYACYHGASLDVVKLLVDKYPDALEERDKNGNSPLMIAQNFQASRRLSTFLMNASSRSTEEFSLPTIDESESSEY